MSLWSLLVREKSQRLIERALKYSRNDRLRMLQLKAQEYQRSLCYTSYNGIQKGSIKSQTCDGCTAPKGYANSDQIGLRWLGFLNVNQQLPTFFWSDTLAHDLFINRLGLSELAN